MAAVAVIRPERERAVDGWDRSNRKRVGAAVESTGGKWGRFVASADHGLCRVIGFYNFFLLN